MVFQTLAECFVYFKEAHIDVKLHSNAYVWYQQNKVNCFRSLMIFSMRLYCVMGGKKRFSPRFPPLDLDFCDID